MSGPLLVTLGGVAASVLLMVPYSWLEWPWCWFAWVIFVPWLAGLDRTRSLRGALASGLAMNLLYVFVFFGWFAETIQIYTGASRAVSLAVLVIAAPILEPHFFVFVAARHMARSVARSADSGARGPSWCTIFAGASAYIAAEWALPKLFGATVGIGLYGSRAMRQAADISGMAGLTFAIVVVNECVLAAMRTLAGSEPTRLRLRKMLLPGTLVVVIPLALLGYGLVRCRQIDTLAARAPVLKVAAVQANISDYERIAEELGTYEGVRHILGAHYTLSSEAIAGSDPDLVIWPETVYPTPFGSPKSPDGAAFDREIARFVAASGRPFIFGSYDAEGDKQFNAAVFIGADASGGISYEMYRKVALFPLTERVPAWLDLPLLREWFPWWGTWTAGSPPEPVAVALADGRQLRVASLICYDALDPELARTAARRGADLIVTLSNDSWFAAGIAPAFHLRLAAFRSIETHLPQIRATNTGISAVITATGDITGSLATGERGVLSAAMPLSAVSGTPMVWWGDWLSPTALVAAILLLGVPWASGLRSRGGGGISRLRRER